MTSNKKNKLKEALSALHREGSNLYESVSGSYMNSLNEFKEYSNTSDEIKKMKYEDIRILFYKHYNKWKQDTMISSDFYKILTHSDFKKIEEMGWAGVPFVLEILNRNDDLVVCALRHMTGLELPSGNKKVNVSELCKLWKEELTKKN